MPPPAAWLRTGAGRVRWSETLGKSTSEESLGPHHEGEEEGQVEDGLRPRRRPPQLEHDPHDPEDEGGDRRTRDGAETADDDDRHERADPVPVERGEDRRLQRERGAADGRGGQAETKAEARRLVGVDPDELGGLPVLDGRPERPAEARLLEDDIQRPEAQRREGEGDDLDDGDRGAEEVDARGTVGQVDPPLGPGERLAEQDRKSTRLNSSHVKISYDVFCVK